MLFFDILAESADKPKNQIGSNDPINSINSDYKELVTQSSCEYVQDTWKEHIIVGTQISYFESLHKHAVHPKSISHNYEENNLIFCSSYELAKDFLTNKLETNKYHIDAILVANTAYSDGGDIIKAQELLITKNLIQESYSEGNFRISAIPMILVVDEIPRTALFNTTSFDEIVEKNKQGDYTNMIEAVECEIRKWRRKLQYDLGELGLLNKRLKGFTQTKGYEKLYYPRVVKNAEMFFVQHTNIVSLEFIKYPAELCYDWFLSSVDAIEGQVMKFGKGFRKHKPYNRYDNENTILHPLLKSNPAVLLRDNFTAYHHERSFPQYAKFSKRPDFILQPAIPEYMKTE